jgi:hypothetical protein
MIADLSRIVEDLTARLDQMSHQEISETFLRMGAITRRFLAVVNYRGNSSLSLFPRYPQLSSSSAWLVVPTQHRCPHYDHPSSQLCTRRALRRILPLGYLR